MHPKLRCIRGIRFLLNFPFWKHRDIWVRSHQLSPGEGQSVVQFFVQCGWGSNRSRVDDSVLCHKNVIVIVDPFPNPCSGNELLFQFPRVLLVGLPHDQFTKLEDLVLVGLSVHNFPGSSSIWSKMCPVVDPGCVPDRQRSPRRLPHNILPPKFPKACPKTPCLGYCSLDPPLNSSVGLVVSGGRTSQ